MKTMFINAEFLSKDIVSFHFKKPDSYTYVAGQFIELHIPHPNADSRGAKRWFTLSSSPTKPYLSITTRISDKPSSFKKTLMGLKQGTEVEFNEPMGDFVLPRVKKPLVFIAGGIGVTPFMSICQFIKDKGETWDIHLLYAARKDSDFIHQDLFEETTNLQKVTGELKIKTVTELIDKIEQPAIYISGPEPLVESLYDQLKTKHNQQQLLRDYFHNYTY